MSDLLLGSTAAGRGRGGAAKVPQRNTLTCSTLCVADIAKMDDILARRATNGFAIPLPPTPASEPMTVAAVFPQIARVNHSWCATSLASAALCTHV